MFKGNRSSYIEIPNTGKLDTKKSITLLANIFPTGENGPIINYKKDGWGVHLWQFSKTQLFARFVTRDGEMSTQPLGTHVLEVSEFVIGKIQYLSLLESLLDLKREVKLEINI